MCTGEMSVDEKQRDSAHNSEMEILHKKQSTYEELENIWYVEDRWVGNYKIVKRLGTGSSSKVFLAHDISTKEKVAIKIVSRQTSNVEVTSETEIRCDKRILREVVISSVLNHPHIVQLKKFLYCTTHYFLVFDYIRGKMLYDIVVSKGPLNEKDAQRYFKQLLSAVCYIHQNSIVHRDLKIENILIDGNDDVKLIDFGLSNFYDNKSLLNTSCGSLYFAAPELLSGQRYYGPEVDVWSLGIILYVLLCGCVPFDDENVRGLQLKIKKAKFDFCKVVSKDAQQLVREMITPQPLSRATLKKVVRNIWVNCGQKYEMEKQAKSLTRRIDEKYIKEISKAMEFQFPNMERDVKLFLKACSGGLGVFEMEYWSRRPVISLYYLLSENLKGCDVKHVFKEWTEAEIVALPAPEAVRRLVEFISFKKHTCYDNRCSDGGNFLSLGNFGTPQPQQADSDVGSVEFPNVRLTYLKGVFKGIRVKHIRSHNMLKSILLDTFNSMGVFYKVTEKSYICIVCYGNIKCCFKVSMYFNIFFREYYVTITPLCSERTLFKNVYQRISFEVKART